MAKRSKKYQAALEKFDATSSYSIEEAVKLAQETSTVNFDASVEVAFRLGIDTRKNDQQIRGAIVLPHGTGKSQRVLVFAKGEKLKEAEEAGADYAGDQEFVQKINGGWFDFDVIVATPDMMGEVGKLGRVLGPKGLMPNPKTGTVTMDVKKAVEEIKAGKIEYRVDKVGNIHAVVGKVSFTKEQLADNIFTLYERMIQLRPSTVRGTYLRNLTISSTMGPGIKVNRSEIADYKLSA